MQKLQLQLYKKLTDEKKEILNEIFRKETGINWLAYYKNNVLKKKLQKTIFTKLGIKIGYFDKNGKNIVLGFGWKKVFFYKDIRAIHAILKSLFPNHNFEIECFKSY